jgi:hypothetical protein
MDRTIIEFWRRTRVGKPVQFWAHEDRRLLRELTVDLVRRPQRRVILDPTMLDVLYDFRELWQSPRSCKLLKYQIVVDSHGWKSEVRVLYRPPYLTPY